jgi:hypothetical protein
MLEAQNFDGQLATRSDEGEPGDEQGAEEISRGGAAPSGPSRISMVSRPTRFSGGTGKEHGAEEVQHG